MTLRNYKIEINPRKGFVMPEHIPSVFGCTVSEPSALAATPRGLTFTGQNQVSLGHHPVFIHRHTFVKTLPGNAPEAAEVDHLVWSLLTDTGITTSQVNVKVSFID